MPEVGRYFCEKLEFAEITDEMVNGIPARCPLIGLKEFLRKYQGVH